MGRPRRLCLPDHTYHAYSRCINRENLLSDDYIKDLFIEVINMAINKYNFHLISYSILNNHFHLILKTLHNGEKISTIMQYIKSVFARKYNKLMKRTGPFWNERYGDKIIERSPNPFFYLLMLLWYLAYNPVRNHLADDPRHYQYSGIHYYLDEEYKPPLEITQHDFFFLLGKTFDERMKRFLCFEKFYNQRILF